METVAVAKLKAGLSRYLASVKRGEEVLVTERGKPVARIVPVGPLDDDARRADLIRRGIMKPGKGGFTRGFLDRLPVVNLPAETIARIIDEEREDRA